MALGALQLRRTAAVEVQTRDEAINFANAALAARKHCGDPLRDYTPGERARARAILSLVREYYALREAGRTRKEAALALRARKDLQGDLAKEDLALGERTLDHWLGELGGYRHGARPPRAGGGGGGSDRAARGTPQERGKREGARLLGATS